MLIPNLLTIIKIKNHHHIPAASSYAVCVVEVCQEHQQLTHLVLQMQNLLLLPWI